MAIFVNDGLNFTIIQATWGPTPYLHSCHIKIGIKGVVCILGVVF
jgi:hypothetical protein